MFDDLDNRMTDFDSDSGSHSPYQFTKSSSKNSQHSFSTFKRAAMFNGTTDSRYLVNNIKGAGMSQASIIDPNFFNYTEIPTKDNDFDISAFTFMDDFNSFPTSNEGLGGSC